MVKYMKNVLIFGGTIEGRALVERLQTFDIMLHVCVVTDYGAGLLPERENICKHVGRLDMGAISELISEIKPVCCVDATHPYAQIVTENVAAVCEKMSCPYIRIARAAQQNNNENSYLFDSVSEAAQFLATTEGVIFATTGSKELEAYTVIPNYKERVVARVLPTVDVMEKCSSLGFEGRNLICMQGPFSEEINYEMLRSTGAKWLVTKCSGAEGGYLEKCEAAIRTGVNLVLIGRPKECENAVGFPQALDLVCTYAGVEASNENAEKQMYTDNVKKIFLIGAGPGSRLLMTKQSLLAVEAADVLIGSKRVLEICDPYNDKVHFACYEAKQIMDYIRNDKMHRVFGVVYSGDIGFYSGAAQLTSCIEMADEKYEVAYVAGISTPVYLLDKLGVRWQDAVLVSNHGCEVNVVPKVRANKVVATLLGKKSDVASMCRLLVAGGLDTVKVVVGERLSYPDETIHSGTAGDFLNKEFDKLSVAVFINEHPIAKMELKDDTFLRGNVPMTKQEIRLLSLAKLGIQSDSVVYDVGAGTGSVSVAMALQAEDGMVYAIEQKEEAKQLIEQNAAKSGCANIKLVAGKAPDVLDELPAPTHAFIGGSSGNLIEIIETIRQKNTAVRFVVNAVTLETVAKLSLLIDKYNEYADMEILFVQISRGKQMGGHHLLTADNGIYIAAFGGK